MLGNNIEIQGSIEYRIHYRTQQADIIYNRVGDVGFNKKSINKKKTYDHTLTGSIQR